MLKFFRFINFHILHIPKLNGHLVFYLFVFISFLMSGVCSYLTKERFLSTMWSQRLSWALEWSCCGCQGYCFTPFVWHLLARLLKGNMSNRFVKALSIKGMLQLQVSILMFFHLPGFKSSWPMLLFTHNLNRLVLKYSLIVLRNILLLFCYFVSFIFFLYF